MATTPPQGYWARAHVRSGQAMQRPPSRSLHAQISRLRSGRGTVVQIDLDLVGQVVALCTRGRERQAISILDLPLRCLARQAGESPGADTLAPEERLRVEEAR